MKAGELSAELSSQLTEGLKENSRTECVKDYGCFDLEARLCLYSIDRNNSNVLLPQKVFWGIFLLFSPLFIARNEKSCLNIWYI